MGDTMPSMLSTLDVGEKVVVGLDVADVGAAMRRFGWPDYITFVLMLSICSSIGLYYGFRSTSSNAQEYLVGGRKMRTIPVAMSLTASFISGVSILGIPTEIYLYGIQYVYIIGGCLLSVLVMRSVYLPIFHDLKLTSIYEYHERRFDKRVRLLGSILFYVELIVWLPLVIYVPALAFNQVSGANVHLVTPIVCVVCVFYTCVGGIKGVVWTDVVQASIMFGAILLVVIKGTSDVGGVGNVIRRNWDGNRIESPNLELGLLSRYTIWSLVIGGTVYTLQTAQVNQCMVQRYLALPSLESAKSAMWIYLFGLVIVIVLCSYCGMLIYAKYYMCDPLTTMLANEKDQLLPLLVMEIFADMSGLPGVFVAGIFSAALSSLSTGLNAMAAIVLEDFYKPFFYRELSEKQTSRLMKLTVIIMGAVCAGLVYIVEKLGSVLQIVMSVGAVTTGPSLGLLTMGVFLPWVNAKGALFGGSFSLIFMSWLCMRAQSLLSSGELTFPEKPVTTEGCHYHFTPKQSPTSNIHFDPFVNNTDITHTDEKFVIYRLSYLWYTFIGTFVTVFVGMLVSFLTKPTDPRDIDSKLLAPFIRRLIKPRKFPNEPSDGIIHAYGPVQTNNETQPVKNDIQMQKVNDTDTA